MKYLRHYNTQSEFAYDRENRYFEPWVSLTEENERVDYNKKPDVPLTFNVTGAGKITFMNYETLEYQINDGSWQQAPMETPFPEINVVPGDVVRFRGTTAATPCDLEMGVGMFYGDYYSQGSQTTCGFYLTGNIMSLLDAENFGTMKDFDEEGEGFVFYGMFKGCTGLTDASGLKLPATGLTTSCYDTMFNGCTGLTAAPELPAPVLAARCYLYMFEGCVSLSSVKCLATDTSASDCTADWLYGTAASGTFITPSSTTWREGSSGIPQGWTRVNA